MLCILAGKPCNKLRALISFSLSFYFSCFCWFTLFLTWLHSKLKRPFWAFVVVFKTVHLLYSILFLANPGNYDPYSNSPNYFLTVIGIVKWSISNVKYAHCIVSCIRQSTKLWTSRNLWDFVQSPHCFLTSVSNDQFIFVVCLWQVWRVPELWKKWGLVLQEWMLEIELVMLVKPSHYCSSTELVIFLLKVLIIGAHFWCFAKIWLHVCYQVLWAPTQKRG